MHKTFKKMYITKYRKIITNSHGAIHEIIFMYKKSITDKIWTKILLTVPNNRTYVQQFVIVHSHKK